jgi:hypothetical protein
MENYFRGFDKLLLFVHVLNKVFELLYSSIRGCDLCDPPLSSKASCSGHKLMVRFGNRMLCRKPWAYSRPSMLSIRCKLDRQAGDNVHPSSSVPVGVTASDDLFSAAFASSIRARFEALPSPGFCLHLEAYCVVSGSCCIEYPEGCSS